MTCILTKSKGRDNTQRRHVKTEAEIGVMQPQAKEHLDSPTALKGQEGSPPSLQRECGPGDTLTLDLGPAALRA